MKPLEGIKVVELSTMLAGPMTARLLAEWGADVIKVESMNGDPWRKQYGTSLSPIYRTCESHFDMQNINKRFVAFNMRTPEGKEAMMKLLATADVFLTNYRVQALEQMGLTYDQLKDQFPKLVHASVLGYGSEGAEKNRPGYDYTAFCARTGFLRDFGTGRRTADHDGWPGWEITVLRSLLPEESRQHYLREQRPESATRSMCRFFRWEPIFSPAVF